MNPPISLPISELKPALVGLGKVIPNRSTLPAVKTLKVERTSDGWICLTATDLDWFVTARLEQPAEGGPLAMLVPFDDLVKVAKSCNKNEHLHLECSPGNEITLGTGQGETRVRSCPVQEFPATPKVQGMPMPVNQTFRLALHEAMACAGTDTSRYVLTGACIDTSQPKAHYLVGTDGRHLFSCNSFNLPLTKSIIIPRHKFLGWKDFNLDGDWVLKLSGEPDGDYRFLQISSRRWRYITRLIDGRYPDWRHVVPNTKDTKVTITLDPYKLEAVIQLIEQAPDCDSVHHSIGIECKDAGEPCLLLHKDAEAEPLTRIPIPGSKSHGRPVTVFVDRRHFIKALKFELNTLDLIDAESPLRFHLSGRQLIVMPVRPTTVQSPEDKTPVLPSGRTSRPSASVKIHQSKSPQHNPSPKLHERKSPQPMPALETTPPSTPTSPLLGQLQLVIEEVDGIGAQHHQTERKLRDLSTKLRSMLTAQKASEKELRSLRQHLRGLQAMRI